MTTKHYPVVKVVCMAVLITLLSGFAPLEAAAAPAVVCTTMVAGNILVDTTWSAAGSPYCLTLNQLTQVSAGFTLTIQPGVTVYVLNSSGGLLVSGTLDAFGTAIDKIYFTSDNIVPQPGDWSGIQLAAGGQAQIEFTEIGFAGFNSADALLVQSNLFELNNSRVHHSGGAGLRFLGNFGYSAIVTDTLFDFNTLEAIVEEPGVRYDRAPAYSGNQLSSNGQDVLSLHSAALNFNRTLDSLGALGGSPYLLLGSGLTINSGRILTLMPGTSLLFANSSGELLVSGTLIAEGIPSRRILFSTVQALPIAGDWGRISIASGGQASLAYCDLAYAGGTSGQALNIDSAQVQMNACWIHDSLGDGISIANTPLLQFTNTAITGNIGTGVRVNNSQLNALHFTLATNTTGVLLEGNSSANFTNSIIADHDLGVSVQVGSLATLDRTLWDSNLVDSSGPIIEVNPVPTGPAYLAADGYHLVIDSTAIDKALPQGLLTDIDGDPRPISHSPDIGADEAYDDLGIFDSLTPGVLEFQDFQGLLTSLQLPAGAVNTTLTIAIKRSVPPAQPLPPPNPNFYYAGHIFDLEVFQNNLKLPGYSFGQPVHVTIHYSAADVAGLNESNLGLFFWSGAAWQNAACGSVLVDPVLNTFDTTICHATQFMLAEAVYLDYLPLAVR